MIKTTARILKRNIQEMSILFFCLLLLNSCASLYFQNVNSPKEPLKLTDLGDLPFYSATIVNLYPLLHGLKIGAKYRYQVFDPQVQDFVEVSQSLDATHIKLVEGGSWLSVLKVGKVIGRVKAEVIDFQDPCQKSE